MNASIKAGLEKEYRHARGRIMDAPNLSWEEGTRAGGSEVPLACPNTRR
jgi:hypothetical protein